MTKAVEDHSVAVATAALEGVATAIGPGRALILAICDPDGRPTDVVVRDDGGRVAVLAGVPEGTRPDLGGVVALASGQLRRPSPTAGASGPEELPVPSAAEQGFSLHTILDAAPIPLLLTDPDGVIEYASAGSQDLGYSSSALIGHPLVDFVHPDDRARLERAGAQLQRGERTTGTIEVRWKRGDGGYASVETRIRVIDDPLTGGGLVVVPRVLSGSWSGVSEMVADMQHQRLLADTADCGVAIASGAEATIGVVLDANAPFGRIAGSTTGQLVGTPLASLVASSDESRVQEALRAIARGGGQQVLVVTLPQQRGADRVVEMTIKADSGEAERRELIVRTRDITEQLRLVGELSRTVDRLERSNHELAEFARITAHDLSAPLLAVSRLIDLVSFGSDDPEFPATLAAIRTAIGRMHGMVDGVMGYTESLETTPTRTVVNVDDALQRALDALSAEIADSGAVITHGALPTVHGDEHQLERVFQNLIANALKFGGDAPPRVHVDAHRESGAWRISVSDEGVGIPEADRGRIFELFSRGGQSTTGRGIGLATCRRIIELHGGRIWVEPNEPRGSTFNFVIPNEPTIASA
ncbi:MAG TPA: ATP-binding protein [Solirubrobacteraceae bacterium]|nr:ATP-binding protein [Solirubrobacteraceae bacterium]